jgi:Fur family transcriptional regulator, ferric uptake regulator
MASPGVDAIFAQIRHRGGRETPAARRILELVLGDEDHHFRGAEVVQLLRLDEPMTESTVYRTLDRLVAHGILERIQLGPGPASYHLAPHHHEHLVCVGCERVLDAPGDLLDEVAGRLQEQYGFVLEIGSSSLQGTCARCRDDDGEQGP